MKLGTVDVSAMYVGTTPVTAAYLGGTQVFGGASVDPFDELMATLAVGSTQIVAHPLRLGGMFIDRAGTVPVTADGDLLGRVTGYGGLPDAVAVSDTARGVYRAVGSQRWVEYNGTNTSYGTAALPAPGADKVQVFAGIRKLNGKNRGIICEISPDASVFNGAFFLIDQITAGQGNTEFRSRGTKISLARAGARAHPETIVTTGLGDISGNALALRINGTQVAQSASDQGSGNYNPSGTHSMAYGARANASLFFMGRSYGTLGPIARFGATATTDQIAAAETYYTTQITA